MEDVVGMRVGLVAVRNKMIEGEGVCHGENGQKCRA